MSSHFLLYMLLLFSVTVAVAADATINTAAAIQLLQHNEPFLKLTGELPGCLRKTRLRHGEREHLPYCSADQERFGFLCLEKCPSTYETNGLVCKSKRRNDSLSWKFRLRLPLRHDDSPHTDKNCTKSACPLDSVKRGPLCMNICPAEYPHPCGLVCLGAKEHCKSMVLGYSATAMSTAVFTANTQSALPVLLQLPSGIQNLLHWGWCEGGEETQSASASIEEDVL